MASADEGAVSSHSGGVLRTGESRLGADSEQRKKADHRVRWDEEAIAEHNKERGTRQKIDEPDTPYVRSPLDSDNESAGSGEEQGNKFKIPAKVQIVCASSVDAGASASNAPTDDHAQALASRLDLLVRSGAVQRRPSTSSAASSEGGGEADRSDANSQASSRSSSFSGPAGGKRKGSKDNAEGLRRISLSADIQPPKVSNDSFKAKRSKHYNEAIALRKWKRSSHPGQDGGESSPDSDTSDENVTKTNTNTNVNRTAPPENVERRHSRTEDDVFNVPGSSSLRGTGSSQRERSNSVTFSENESGHESGKEFRDKERNSHKSEWKKDPSVALTVSDLVTNTNTNVNVGRTTGEPRKPRPRSAEKQKPPVKVPQGEEEPMAEKVTEEFKNRRHNHYDEVAAMKRFKEQLAGQKDEAELEEETPGVAFTIATDIADAVLGTEHHKQGQEKEDWEKKRAQHYGDMAAALRNMPPPSDDEDSD